MKAPRKAEIPHKLALYKLLTELLSDPFIANNIYFKGGTCAAMLGYLDRFSVDLDFDLLDTNKKENLRSSIHKVFKKINFAIKDESEKQLQFFLKYRDTVNKRNTLKLEITNLVPEANKYEKVYLKEIDKYCSAQTVETMFANKLIALKARWEEGRGIAGRDVYDIGHFFEQGYGINRQVIKERGKASFTLSPPNVFTKYIQELVEFVENKVSEKILWEDLNPLMSKEKLQKTIPHLKQSVLLALREYC